MEKQHDYLLFNKAGEIYTHLIPLSGGVFSLVFLNTTLETFHLVSALLIVFGIWLCSKTPQQA